MIIILFLTLLFNSLASSAPNTLEVESIQNEVKQQFDVLLSLWQEERYFEMYDWGTSQSQEQLKLKVELLLCWKLIVAAT